MYRCHMLLFTNIIFTILYTTYSSYHVEMPIRDKHVNLTDNINLTRVNLQQLNCSNNKTYTLLRHGHRFGYTFNVNATLYNSSWPEYIKCNITFKHGQCRLFNNTVCDTYKLDGIYNTLNYVYSVLYAISCKNRNYYIWGSSVLRMNTVCFKIAS